MSNDEDEQEEMLIEGHLHHDDTTMVSLSHMEKIIALVQHEGTITLLGSLRCTVCHVWETLQEQRVTVMLDSRATLNFINLSLVKQRSLPMEMHAGFQVKVVGGTLLPCTHLVP